MVSGGKPLLPYCEDNLLAVCLTSRSATPVSDRGKLDATTTVNDDGSRQ